MGILLSLQTSGIAGMGFGGWKPTPPPPPPDLIITPGPIKSPMRITTAPNGTFFISDYQGQEIVSINRATPDKPESVMPIEGYPLGLVYTKKFLIVGNDSAGTIDVYHTINGKKIKSFETEGPIQASDLAFDENENILFVADSRNHEVKVFSMMGHLIRTFGLDAPLADPKGIAIDPDSRQVFVSDYGDPRVGIAASINIFDYDGRLLKRLTGAFSRPQGIVIDAGRIYFVDVMLGQVLIFNRSTYAKVGALGSFGTAAGSLLLPMDLARDPATGKLFVTNYRMGRVDIFTPPNP
jgi:DNA-binding beta-propeller fold protein YncE